MVETRLLEELSLTRSRVSLRAKAVLLDVGGTLLPNEWLPADPTIVIARVQRAAPALDAPAFVARFGAEETHAGRLTLETIRRVASDLGSRLAPESIEAVRRALCIPMDGNVALFPFARELLARIRDLGLRSILVSNTRTWGAGELWRDFLDFGVGEFIHAIVTSFDVRRGKPHRAMFDAAVQAAGCLHVECIMVGNSESVDIEPAVALGMTAIRVAIEEPRPERTSAHHLALSLSSVARLL